MRSQSALNALGWDEDLSELEIEAIIVLSAEHLGAVKIDRPLPIGIARLLKMPATPASTHAIRQALESLARRGLLDRVTPATRRHVIPWSEWKGVDITDGEDSVAYVRKLRDG